MKVIHCADLHLDSALNANLEGEKKKIRKAELTDNFRRLVDDAVSEGVSAILIAGDLFDTKHVAKGVQTAVMHAITGHPEIAFYYLRGNHDADGFLEGLDEVPANLHIFGDSWSTYALDPDGEVLLTSAEPNGNNMATLPLSLTLDMSKCNLVMLHGQQVQTNARDKAEVVPIPAYAGKGIDYLALGHVHARQEGELDRRGHWCYPGCLEGRGFDECGEHGYMLLEIDEKAHTVKSSFVPFAKRILHTVEVDVTGCENSSEMIDCVQKQLKARKIAETSLVKVVLKGEVEVTAEKNVDYIRNGFADGFFFGKCYDETKLHVDYMSYLHDESLKGEFIRTVMNSDHSEEEKTELIRCGLMALEGEWEECD